MLDKYQALLSRSYDIYKSTKNRHISQSFTNLSQAEKTDFFDAYEYLIDSGYIEQVYRSIGFCQYKLTPYGISFVENGYADPQLVPVIQGDNSIYVQGSNNAISDNYNQISVEIRNSDLSEDCKQLIESLLYDIKNPHITPNKKSERIAAFFKDIGSDTLSNTAVSGLTALLMTLFNQILP